MAPGLVCAALSRGETKQVRERVPIALPYMLAQMTLKWIRRVWLRKMGVGGVTLST